MRENEVVDEFYQGFTEEYEKYSENYASYSRDYENYINNYMTYMKNYDINSENYASYIEQAKTRSELDEDKMKMGVIRGLIPDASSHYNKNEPEPLYRWDRRTTDHYSRPILEDFFYAALKITEDGEAGWSWPLYPLDSPLITCSAHLVIKMKA